MYYKRGFNLPRLESRPSKAHRGFHWQTKTHLAQVETKNFRRISAEKIIYFQLYFEQHNVDICLEQRLNAFR